jgi:uncharacterized protein YdaL
MAREDRSRLRSGLLALTVLCGGGRAAAAVAAANSMRVCVYYDVGNGATAQNGRLYAIMLDNLLGHFQEATVELTAARAYADGGLTHCDRAAYIGSEFNAPPPPNFLRDVARATAPFLWINANIRALENAMGPDAFARKSGFHYLRTDGFDRTRPTEGVPDFYRFVDYKGERFVKTAILRVADHGVVATPEIAILSLVDAQVLATAVHSGTGATTPYATVLREFYFIADNPFVYIAENDRYLVAADLLFDFLRLPPRSLKRRAVVRLEDVHPAYNLRLLDAAVDLLQSKKTPFALSLIPKYVPAGEPETKGAELERRPDFLRTLVRAQAAGATLLLHGYTHSVPDSPACPSLASGYDVEFWDRCAQAPLSSDSDDYVRGRIGRARGLLQAAGIVVDGWVTPHYMASPVDFMAFGKLFDRTMGRVRYEPERDASKSTPPSVSQFFPYTIYRDHYGQFVWPENLGFVPLPSDDGPGRESIVADARRARVLRDGWASFFWHPQLMAVPGEPARLASVIDGIRAAGYEFVSLHELRAAGE